MSCSALPCYSLKHTWNILGIFCFSVKCFLLFEPSKKGINYD